MKTKRQAVMYHCDGCQRPIAATPADPVHKPGSKTLCTKCLGRFDDVEAPLSQRGKAAKERWEGMSVSEQLARVKALQAGRRQ